MSSSLDNYLMANAKFFPEDKMPFLKDKLATIDEGRFSTISMLSLKDPTIMLVISLFGGSLGVDRFMLGQTGLGVAKLLTLGGCGIWTIIDWFSIMNRTREDNYAKVMLHL